MDKVEIFKDLTPLENVEVLYLDGYLTIPGPMRKLHFTLVTEPFDVLEGKMVPELPATTGMDTDQIIYPNINPVTLLTTFTSETKVTGESFKDNKCYGLYFVRTPGTEPIIAIRFKTPLNIFSDFVLGLAGSFTTAFNEEYFNGLRQSSDPVTNKTRYYFYSIAPPNHPDGFIQVEGLNGKHFTEEELAVVYQDNRFGRLNVSTIPDIMAARVEQHHSLPQYDFENRSIISVNIKVSLTMLTDNIPSGVKTHGFVFKINPLQDFPLVFFYESALSSSVPQMRLDFNYRSIRRE